jgi:type IV secretion system protein VirB5
MRKYLFAITALSGGLALAPDAHAQMAVYDGANLAQNVQTAAQSIAAVEQLKAQLSQLEQTYTMFTNPTNILSMATGMENQAEENPMPLANSLTGLVEGKSSGFGAATTYYSQNHIYTAPAGTLGSAQLNANGQGIANIEGIASTNLSAIEQRLQQLPDLEADLNSATSITQVSAINGRIAAESQFVQAQQAQATNLQVLASEQQASQQQQEQEAHQESDANLLEALNSASP